MSNDKERRFKNDVFTPETLPMERLAEYMLQFAKLLGEPERVHFVDVEAGSAVLRARVVKGCAEGRASTHGRFTRPGRPNRC